MARWHFIPPNQFYYNTTWGGQTGNQRKTSGMPYTWLNLSGGANTNVIVGIPLPAAVDDGWGRTPYISTVALHHLISAVSAGVTPLLSASVRAYEVQHEAGGLSSAPGTIGLPNSLISAGFVTSGAGGDVSATNWTYSAGSNPSAISGTATAVASLWGTSQLDTFTNIAAQTRNVGESGTHYFLPRLENSLYSLEISASVAVSGYWELYGAWVKFA